MSTTESDVKNFLQEFFAKLQVFDIIFRDGRPKNSQTLLSFEMTSFKRQKLIESLQSIDYCEGPLTDHLNRISDMWVFGREFKGVEFYIKISLGVPSNPVLCISFHPAEFPLSYPFRKKES